MKKKILKTLCSFSLAMTVCFSSMAPTVAAAEMDTTVIEETFEEDDETNEGATIEVSTENESTNMIESIEITKEAEEIQETVSEEAYEIGDFLLSGSAHVQTYGDMAAKFDKDTTTLSLGTTGKDKRLEAILIDLSNYSGHSGTLQYRVHRQTYGWTDWVNSGTQAGTVGQGKRIEAIQIRLTGELAQHYSVEYRVYIEGYKWNLGWKNDGELAGTEGEAKRLEALEVRLVPITGEIDTAEINVEYRVHRQTYGWENKYASMGSVSGTVGQGKRLEGIEINASNPILYYTSDEDGVVNGIRYKTYIQGLGWEKDWKENGQMSGTYGQARRLEAISIELTGRWAQFYNVYYRVHAQTYGWLNWARNGEAAGTMGLSKRLEAIQIVIVPITSEPPSSNYNGIKNQRNEAAIYAKGQKSSLIDFIKSFGVYSKEPIYNDSAIIGYKDQYTLFTGYKNTNNGTTTLLHEDSYDDTYLRYYEQNGNNSMEIQAVSNDGDQIYNINDTVNSNTRINYFSIFDVASYYYENGYFYGNNYYWDYDSIYNSPQTTFYKNTNVNDISVNTVKFCEFSKIGETVVPSPRQEQVNALAKNLITELNTNVKNMTGFGIK